MAGAGAVELAEALDGVERHRRLAERLVVGVDRLDAGQVQERVEQHRGVADRQHEAVAVRPDRLLGIVAQEALPEACRPPARGPSARRGGPEFAACTASIASVRMVLIAS